MKHPLFILTFFLIAISAAFAADVVPQVSPEAAGGFLKSHAAKLWIPVLVPLVIAVLKSILPSIPRVSLPILCPLIGVLLSLCAAGVNQDIDPSLAAVLGLAGNGLREILDQIRKQAGMSLNKQLAMAATILCLGLPATAAETPQPASTAPASRLPRLTAADLAGSYYRAGEWSIDAFGSGRLNGLKDLRDLSRVQYSGGIGANWFPFAAGGIGVEALSHDTHHSFLDQVGAKLLGRLPWYRFAFNFGVGGEFNFESDHWDVFAEVGPEFRFTPRLGAFADIRGVRPVTGPGVYGEHLRITLGGRYAF